MIIGHYAAALIPHSRGTRAPLWLYLLCANIPEFLWLLLALFGLEAPKPGSLLDASFNNIRVDMIYSHNLLPAAAQAFVVMAIVHAVWRDGRVTFWCGFLVILHVLCDYVVGFEHQLLGRHSMPVAMNTYGHAPYLAITIELVFALACIAWYDYSNKAEGRPMPRAKRVALYAVFVIGIVMWYPAAKTPLRELLRALGVF